MAKFAYEKAHADIVKYDNSDLLQTRSGETANNCGFFGGQNYGGRCLFSSEGSGFICGSSIGLVDEGMSDPTL
jgi:hypothetical protein